MSISNTSAEMEQMKQKNAASKDIFQPEFFRLSNESDKKSFDQLIETGNVFIYDELYDQLKELVKILHPKERLTEDRYSAAIAGMLNGSSIDQYGVWVYYPWSRQLVHILDEKEFIEVRTSRNQYKITLEERDILASKKVGIIGLSVGQSVALTMAMERSFGELRLADFDVLELTNLNRIRTGLYNLGIKKVVAVAREILHIDPFLNIKIFPDGLTEENMDSFYTGGGKLDVLVDECDGVDIKILCRHKAKALGIPVLMEASDRTTIDVERFDLEPDRSILHGFIDHLDVSRLKYLKTNEERVPYLAPMVGIDTMSVRLKASAIEVGQSITTWPQLASAVALGGGAVADIWRRIALDQYHESGRYFVDMEEIAGDKKKPAIYNVDDHIPVKAISDKEAQNMADAAAHSFPAGYIVLPENVITAIADAAAAAPSGGNSQPWKLVYKNGILTLLHDRYYSYSFMDFQDRSSYLALGAAIENIVLNAHQHQLEAAIQYFPLPEEKTIIANFAFYPKGNGLTFAEPHLADELAEEIALRHTNRKITVRSHIADDKMASLIATGQSVQGAQVSLFSAQEQLDEIGDIISVTDKFRLLYPQSHNDFTYQEMRWTHEEAELRRTGMDVNTLELQPSELVGLRLIRDPKVVEFLRHINGGNVFRNVSRKCMSTAAMAGILTVPAFGVMDYINGGRALQRLWLRATQLNLAFHVMNVPLPFFSRLEHDPSDLPAEIVDELQQEYLRFNGLVNKERRETVALFRIFEAEKPDIAPLRRNIKDVLILA